MNKEDFLQRSITEHLQQGESPDLPLKLLEPIGPSNRYLPGKFLRVSAVFHVLGGTLPGKEGWDFLQPFVEACESCQVNAGGYARGQFVETLTERAASRPVDGVGLSLGSGNGGNGR